MDEEKIQTSARDTAHYKGLGHLIHGVRWFQHLLAIVAEALILLSFAMSGMDVSLGGVLAGIPLIKVLWAAMFALGIDTAFALSWVRVRQCVMRRQWLAFIGNLLLALAMSVIVFQPLAIQLLQQSLDLNFNQAVASLGVNIIFLTYARSGVAVFLGAILAMTNVESGTPAHAAPAPAQPKRQFIRIEQLFQKAEPITDSGDMVVPIGTAPGMTEEVLAISENTIPSEPSDTTEAQTAEQSIVPEQPEEEPAQPEPSHYDTPEQRAARVSEIDFTGLSAPERIAKVLELFPDLSDRELGRLSKQSAATAKKHKEALLHAQPAKQHGSYE